MKIHRCLFGVLCLGLVWIIAGCGSQSVEYGDYIPEVQDTSLYGTFDDAGNYITARGILLTADQYEEFNWCLSTESIDTFSRARFQDVLMWGSGIVFNEDEYLIENTSWQKTDVQNDRKMTDMNQQRAEDAALKYVQEALGEPYAIRRTYYDEKTDIWMVDFYCSADTGAGCLEILSVYMNHSGEIIKVYQPYFDSELLELEYKVSRPSETYSKKSGYDTFSFEDTVRISGFVHDNEENRERTKRELMDIANQEISAGGYEDFLDGKQIRKLCYASKAENVVYRISYYWMENPAKQIHVYVSGKGQTLAMYVHEGE